MLKDSTSCLTGDSTPCLSQTLNRFHSLTLCACSVNLCLDSSVTLNCLFNIISKQFLNYEQNLILLKETIGRTKSITRYSCVTSLCTADLFKNLHPEFHKQRCLRKGVQKFHRMEFFSSKLITVVNVCQWNSSSKSDQTCSQRHSGLVHAANFQRISKLHSFTTVSLL